MVRLLVRRFIRETIEFLLLVVLLLLILRFSVQNFRVTLSSMLPTLKEGEIVFVNKAVYSHINGERVPFWQDGDGRRLFPFPFHPPRSGEIIVFESPRNPGRNLVKRVMAGPGDTVEIRRGKVVVNGEQLTEPYLPLSARDDVSNYPPTTLGSGQYFVLGDNRLVSEDSRYWGPVPLDNIVGKVWVRLWPPGQIGLP